MERLFFALKPDVAACAAIAETARRLQRDLQLSGTLLAEEHLHVTLHHLGDYEHLPEELVSRACSAADDVVALRCFKPFVLTLRSAFSFPPRDEPPPPLAARVEGDLLALFALWETLGKYLRHAGVATRKNKRANFVPHVTLLYRGREKATSLIPTISWTVRDFVLTRSLIGQTKHIELEKWPLIDVARC
jgi:RNA 2',3'-cyclic 3'-phosphodiesterase